MVSNFHLPPTGYGPGSQPEADGDTLEYTPMPQDMRTYSPHLPEPEAVAGAQDTLALLEDISLACAEVAAGAPGRVFDLREMDAINRKVLAETLGHGEVSVRARGIPAIAAQESVFAGVWVLNGDGVDAVEVAPVPSVALTRAHKAQRPVLGLDAPKPTGLANAPALLVELLDKSADFAPGQAPHVINLTLLPHTEPDLLWLDSALGEGAVTILSRGYGNCRVTAMALPHVWRVQFYNSTDALILDTFEVTTMPEVALAAPEDLTDSADRILKVLEAIR